MMEVHGTPKETVMKWVEYFNAGEIDRLTDLYSEDAVNHQVVMEPLNGREAIKRMFEIEFARATMVCIPEIIHESGEWAILEWRDPLGLRGCGFFRVIEGKIRFQRGYFDQLTFFRIQGLEVPKEYLG
jgi:hypothetical protein